MASSLYIFFIEKKCLDILARNGYNIMRVVRLLQRLDRHAAGASWELHKSRFQLIFEDLRLREKH